MVKKNNIKIHSIKIFSAILILIISLMIYLLLHGTKDLFIFQLLSKIFTFIPLVEGINCQNSFITSYLIDILWANSLLLFISSKKNIYLYFVAIIFFVVSEVLQFIFSCLGTFDIFDIIFYVVLSLIYFLVDFIYIKFIHK